MKEKSYWVLWTYVANFSSLRKVTALSAADAAAKVTSLFSDDFHNRATVLVFDQPPVLHRGATS
jgi:hypothetical protein